MLVLSLLIVVVVVVVVVSAAVCVGGHRRLLDQLEHRLEVALRAEKVAEPGVGLGTGDAGTDLEVAGVAPLGLLLTGGMIVVVGVELYDAGLRSVAAGQLDLAGLVATERLGRLAGRLGRPDPVEHLLEADEVDVRVGL